MIGNSLSGASRLTVFALRLVVVGVLLIAWARWLEPTVLGRPHQVWAFLTTWLTTGEAWLHIGTTLRVFLTGYLVATVLGVALGCLLALSKDLNLVLEPFLAFANSLPRMMFYPFFAIWLGFGFVPRVIHVVFVVIILVAFTTAAGVREVDRDIIANIKVMGGSGWDLVRHVYIPAIISWIVGSTKTIAGYAFQAALVAEFIGSSRGLGHFVASAQSRFAVSEMWGAIVVMAVIAVVLESCLSVVERRGTRWMT